MSMLLKKLRRIAISEHPIPKGYKKTDAWAKEWGLCESQTRKLIAQGCEAGLIKMVKLKRVSAQGSARVVPYYGEVKK